MSGIVLLSNIGPEIEVSTVLQSVVCYEYKTVTKRISDQLTSYKIVLCFSAAVLVLIPGSPTGFEIKNEATLVDSVIRGKVQCENVETVGTIGTVRTFDLIP